MTNQLAVVAETPGETGLDRILRLFEQVTTYADKYLTCPNCDAGCPRLMNLAMLHQRQVNLLCEIAKNPITYLSSDTTRVALGEYQPCIELDIMLKRIMLLGAVRCFGASVSKFTEKAGDFEARHIAGTLELGEVGKLNLKWLLDVAANLRRRVDCIKIILEKEDWAFISTGGANLEEKFS
ncbi:Fc.00g115460.m01.CDS01 [Cosmosporella sp. VM-42]